MKFITWGGVTFNVFDVIYAAIAGIEGGKYQMELVLRGTDETFVWSFSTPEERMTNFNSISDLIQRVVDNMPRRVEDEMVADAPSVQTDEKP